MKTIHCIKRLTAVFAILFMAMNVFSQITQPTTTIGEVSGICTDAYTVSVTVAIFSTEVGNISLIMNYDQSKLTDTGIALNSGFNSLDGTVYSTPTTDVSGQISELCKQESCLYTNIPGDSFNPDVVDNNST